MFLEVFSLLSFNEMKDRLMQSSPDPHEALKRLKSSKVIKREDFIKISLLSGLCKDRPMILPVYGQNCTHLEVWPLRSQLNYSVLSCRALRNKSLSDLDYSRHVRYVDRKLSLMISLWSWTEQCWQYWIHTDRIRRRSSLLLQRTANFGMILLKGLELPTKIPAESVMLTESES